MRKYRSPLQKIRRLIKLLECLQSGRDYNARDLAEICGVTRRQIFRDLKALQDSGISVLFDESRGSYRVPHPTFLPAAELTLEESLTLLALAANLGDPQDGIPLQEAARDAAVKLSSNLPAHLRQYVGDLTDSIRVYSPQPARLDNARDRLNLFHRALHEHRKVRLRYQSLFEQTEISTLISPYRLFFCRHAWYVVGRSSLHRAVRMFHLGRIQSCELTEDGYQVPERFSLKRHLGNAWQFIRVREPDTKVRIRFQPLVATNVSEILWHKTQRLTWNDDGTLDFEVRVSGINEISWWVMGYGDQAEVLEPQSLRDLLAQRAARVHKQYRRKVTREGARNSRKKANRKP
ncbi:MAG: WYL domain-containing transcriptional regulator [Planctomycetaceae bacterium]|nr:WYL domain-containing transcriptional regulator [Planctomycetaceae bacterium]